MLIQKSITSETAKGGVKKKRKLKNQSVTPHKSSVMVRCNKIAFFVCLFVFLVKLIFVCFQSLGFCKIRQKCLLEIEVNKTLKNKNVIPRKNCLLYSNMPAQFFFKSLNIFHGSGHTKFQKNCHKFPFICDTYVIDCITQEASMQYKHFYEKYTNN